MSWKPINNGATLGQRGSENGAILRDEEHELGARITLECDGTTAPWAITCGIYGWMVHTRFFGSEAEATAEMGRMKDALGVILSMIPGVNDPAVEAKARLVEEAIQAFIKRKFP